MTTTTTTSADQLGPLEIIPDPVAACVLERRREEQRELMRIAAVSALERSRGGKDLDPAARRWAQAWSTVKPLGRPLGTGEPT